MAERKRVRVQCPTPLANVDHLDETLLRQLCTTAPDDFVATRNAIVKRLKSDGDRALAAEVAAMRRPSWIDWALDVAAGGHDEVAAAFADAAADMRDAQRAATAGRTDSNLRGSISELRERSAALVRSANEVLAKRGRPSSLPELTERLAGVAASEWLSEQMRVGLLRATDREGDAGDGNGFGSLGDDGAPEPKPATARRRPAAAPAPAAKRSKSEQAGERRRRERDVTELERTLAATQRQLTRADTAVRHATAGAEAAAAKVAEATAALQHAEQRLADMTGERDALAESAAETSKDLDRARRSLDSLGG